MKTKWASVLEILESAAEAGHFLGWPCGWSEDQRRVIAKIMEDALEKFEAHGFEAHDAVSGGC